MSVQIIKQQNRTQPGSVTLLLPSQICSCLLPWLEKEVSRSAHQSPCRTICKEPELHQ